MAKYVHRYTQDLHAHVHAHVDDGLVFKTNVDAHTIEVEVLNNGAAASLTGSVSGTVIRANGTTVAVSGTLSGGNICSITLPSAAYAIDGPIAVFITLTSGTTVTTLLKAIYMNEAIQAGSSVDPGTVIPSINTLLAAIESAEASIPADLTNLMASLAPTFSTSVAYTVGDYAWYDGKLYRFIVDHSAGTWNADHVSRDGLGNDVQALRNYIASKGYNIESYYLDGSGGKTYSFTFAAGKHYHFYNTSAAGTITLTARLNGTKTEDIASQNNPLSHGEDKIFVPSTAANELRCYYNSDAHNTLFVVYGSALEDDMTRAYFDVQVLDDYAAQENHGIYNAGFDVGSHETTTNYARLLSDYIKVLPGSVFTIPAVTG